MESKEVILDEDPEYLKAVLNEDLREAIVQTEIRGRIFKYAGKLIAPAMEEEYERKKAESQEENFFILYEGKTAVIAAVDRPSEVRREFDCEAAMKYLEESGLENAAKARGMIFETGPRLEFEYGEALKEETEKLFREMKRITEYQFGPIPLRKKVIVLSRFKSDRAGWEFRKKLYEGMVLERLNISEAKALGITVRFDGSGNAKFVCRDYIVSIVPGKKKIEPDDFAAIAGKDRLEEFVKTTVVERKKPSLLFAAPERYVCTPPLSL